jgi:pyruvate formate lyase activating enzyme
MQEALYYKQLPEQKVKCILCPHNCLLANGKVGVCAVRKNINGHLYALTYAKVSSLNLDPIEKKPLYQYKPGTKILSAGSLGCNLSCPFCQNWSIAQPKSCYHPWHPEEVVTTLREVSPAKLANLALSHQQFGNIGVAFTYNEPFIWFEYVLETAQLVKEKGLDNILVTNGFVNQEPLKELLPFIDAVNLDIKGFSNAYYRRLGGRLEPVLATALMLKKSCHLEITNLLVTGLNTDTETITALINWIADNLGTETPLHFSRYFPAYKLNAPPTPYSILEKAQHIAAQRLKNVYLGNV